MSDDFRDRLDGALGAGPSGAGAATGLDEVLRLGRRAEQRRTVVRSVVAAAAVIAVGTAGTTVALLVDSPGDGADLPASSSTPTTPTTTPSTPASTSPSAEEARQMLAELADQDAEAASALVGSWVPQLASAQAGLVTDGGTRTDQDILDEHLEIRSRYPSALLLASSEWNFQNGGYWVTVVGTPHAGWRPALEFCRDQGFDAEDCIAKLLRPKGGQVFDTTAILTVDGRVPSVGPGG